MELFNKVWSILERENEYFSKILTYEKYKVDLKQRSFRIEGRISTDSMRLFQMLFSDKFLESSPSMDTVFTRIKKIANKQQLNIDISKKEYDDYVLMVNESIDAKGAFRTIANMQDDMRFLIPSRNDIESNHRNAVDVITGLFPSFFSYTGREARCSLDFNGFVKAIDVFMDSDVIHLETNEGQNTAFNEYGVSSNIGLKELVVRDIDAFSVMDNTTIYVSYSTIQCLDKFSKLFPILNMKIRSYSLVFEILKGNLEQIKSNQSIKINDQLAMHFIADALNKALLISDATEKYNRMVELAKIASLFTIVERQHIFASLSEDIEDDIKKAITYIINNDHSDLTGNLEKLFDKKKIRLVAKVNRNVPAVVVYNGQSNSVLEVKLDRNSVLVHLIPDLGGIRYIFSNISTEKQDNALNVENIVVSQVMYYLQEMYHRLELFLGVRNNGIFSEDKVIVALSGKPSSRVNKGLVFLDSDLKIETYSKKATRKVAVSAYEAIRRDFDDSVVNPHTAMGIIFSSCLVDIVSPIFTPNISFSSSSEDGFELFKNIFLCNTLGYMRDLSGSNIEFIESSISNSSSPVFLHSLNKELIELANLPYKKKTYKRKKTQDYTYETEKRAQIFTDQHVDGFLSIEVIASEGLLSNIYAGQRTENMGKIISFIVASQHRVKAIASDLRGSFQTKISKTIQANSNETYVFFETVLPSLVFHSIMYGTKDVWKLFTQISINHTLGFRLAKSEVVQFFKKKNMIRDYSYAGAKSRPVLEIDLSSVDLALVPEILRLFGQPIDLKSYKNYTEDKSGQTMNNRKEEIENVSFFSLKQKESK